MCEQMSSHFVRFLFSVYVFKLQLSSLISHFLLKAHVLENYEVKSLCTTCRHTLYRGMKVYYVAQLILNLSGKCSASYHDNFIPGDKALITH